MITLRQQRLDLGKMNINGCTIIGYTSLLHGYSSTKIEVNKMPQFICCAITVVTSAKLNITYEFTIILLVSFNF